MEEKVLTEQTVQIENGGRNLAVVLGTVATCVAGYFLVKGVKKGVKFVGNKISEAHANRKAKKAAKLEVEEKLEDSIEE